MHGTKDARGSAFVSTPLNVWRHCGSVRRALRGLPGVADVTIHGYELRVLFEAAVDWEAAAGRLHEAAEQANAPLRRVYPLEPTLEDLFIGYARGHARAA